MSNTTTTTTKSILDELKPTQEEILKYRRSQIESADRSFLNDRLNVQLPEGLYGEWIGRNDFSQYQAKAKGFVDGSEFLGEFNKLYETADGRSAVGDVMFMVIPKWKYDEQQRVIEAMATRRSGINTVESNEATAYLEAAESIGLGVDRGQTNETRVIDGTELSTILKAGK